MYRTATVGVVVPAYNEAGFVGDVIREMPTFVDRLYVVDDRSTDDTWDEILEAAREDREGRERDVERDDRKADAALERSDDPWVLADGGSSALTRRAFVHEPVGRVVPIRHHENLGAGGAIKTGYLAALAGEMDVTVTVDADGQMDLSQMPKLLDPIVEGGADYAKGNRLLSREYRAAMPRFRLFGNTVLTFLTKIASGYWKTMDPQNGYTAISHDALEAVDVEGLFEYYGYCNDLLVKLNASGMRVADVAMPAVYGDEESSIGYSTYIPKVSLLLLRTFLWRLKTKYLVTDFHPLALFYLFGAAVASVGMLAGVRSMYAGVSGAESAFAAVVASGLLFAVGATLVLFAMVFDMQENEHRERQIA